MKLKNYITGDWVEGEGQGVSLLHAVTGEEIATATTSGLDFASMLAYARNVGGPALRKMTFHDRALMLKALALYLTEKKPLFYKLSAATGATKTDSWIDIDGGIGNLFVYASKGRRELPNQPFYIDGNPEMLSKGGSFLGHHIAVPKEGVAIHINAFNFPVWGMLEKIAVNFLAGVPAIVKPATATAFLTELVVREIALSNILPAGSLQLICGSAGTLLDYVDSQDVVTFTGSAQTGKKLRAHPAMIENSVPFNMEADSLNSSVLGPDAAPGTEEYNLFIREVVREMTVKAGQKCTAIRRVIVPEKFTEDVLKSLKERLDKVILGDPSVEGVKMGPLASRGQVEDVMEKVSQLRACCELAYGNPDKFEINSGSKEKGAFMPAILLYCDNPLRSTAPHNIEAFGPVSTVMPYKTTADAIEITRLGKGSLVCSTFTADDDFAAQFVLGAAAYHGRILVVNSKSAGESTGHGSPMPHLVHGGPGRAGGGEEMGGIRGVMHYMQRTAIQGSPTTLSNITRTYLPGAEKKFDLVHPFRKYFDELQIGDSLTTHKRSITEADIINFANVSWDHFYAHTDITSLDGSIFEQRVAHGYFILSAAAGLFVDPGKGPVLANYGLEDCRFLKPVYAGSTIWVQLTCKEKMAKEKRENEQLQGVVKWYVEVFDQDNEAVAVATILTLVARKENVTA